MDAVTTKHLCEILRDAAWLKRKGHWPEAAERCREAVALYRLRRSDRPVGAMLAVDMLAGDLATMIGHSRESVRAVAHEILLDSPLLAVARALANFRRQIVREGR